MGTLIFDIETVGEDWTGLDDTTQSVVTRWIDRTVKDEVEHAAALADLKAGLGFSPLTGRIVALGVYDLERAQGVVYYTGEGDEAEYTIDEYTYKQRNERQMLEEFWDGARHYETFVTYNGRCFDAPFLAHRSITHGVRVTKNLLEGRYLSQQKSCRHIDLQDELTFYGAMQRRPSLHLFCRAYGITSSKEDVGGDDVAELFKAKKFCAIAEYNARDVVATTELYQRWQAYQTGLEQAGDIDY